MNGYFDMTINAGSVNIRTAWKNVWVHSAFRATTIVGVFLFTALLFAFPIFFNLIESKNGWILNDPIINFLPAYNLSLPIFFIIWGMSMLMVIRCIQDPYIFLLFLWSFIVMSAFRMTTMFICTLEAPVGLIELKDPITSIFYGNKFITKDLFFSGHTATQFLFFLCLQNKKDKILALIATIAIGTMVLFQHVHFTIDVLAAPLFTWIAYILAKRLLAIIQKASPNWK
jgi:hypothetical protein